MTRSQAVTFGRPASLVGVVTRPSDGSALRPQTVIILNAGIIHHVGPNRLHVLLAERLARAGFQSLRFDLSGIGDSDIRRDDHDLESTVLRDIDDAVTLMTARYGAERFVLMGLCTGANNALRFALRDERVAGVVPIDPFSYKTLGFHIRHYGRRLLRAESWRNALTGKNRYLAGLLRKRAEDDEARTAFSGVGGTVAPPPRVERSEMQDIFDALVEREVPVLQVFTGGNIRYNYRNQFWDSFPSLPREGAIDVEFMPDAGHTFGRRAHRESLMDVIEAWMTATQFPR